MAHFVGLYVSVKATLVCVVDDADKVILQQQMPMSRPTPHDEAAWRRPRRKAPSGVSS
jgi:hypothetical protein